MKKSKSKTGKGTSGTSKKRMSNLEKTETGGSKNEIVDLDDEEVGFGAWLKSGDGMEWMRLFVIGNSIVVFLTMTWPQMQKTFEIIKELIYGEEDV